MLCRVLACCSPLTVPVCAVCVCLCVCVCVCVCVCADAAASPVLPTRAARGQPDPSAAAASPLLPDPPAPSARRSTSGYGNKSAARDPAVDVDSELAELFASTSAGSASATSARDASPVALPPPPHERHAASTVDAAAGASEPRHARHTLGAATGRDADGTGLRAREDVQHATPDTARRCPRQSPEPEVEAFGMEGSLARGACAAAASAAAPWQSAASTTQHVRHAARGFRLLALLVAGGGSTGTPRSRRSNPARRHAGATTATSHAHAHATAALLALASGMSWFAEQAFVYPVRAASCGAGGVVSAMPRSNAAAGDSSGSASVRNSHRAASGSAADGGTAAGATTATATGNSGAGAGSSITTSAGEPEGASTTTAQQHRQRASHTRQQAGRRTAPRRPQSRGTTQGGGRGHRHDAGHDAAGNDGNDGASNEGASNDGACNDSIEDEEARGPWVHAWLDLLRSCCSGISLVLLCARRRDVAPAAIDAVVSAVSEVGAALTGTCPCADVSLAGSYP